jgi:hypothetical protein
LDSRLRGNDDDELRVSSLPSSAQRSKIFSKNPKVPANTSVKESDAELGSSKNIFKQP